MAHVLIAIVATVIVWWLSTGVVMMASRKRLDNRALVLGGATAVAIAAAIGLHLSAQMATTAGVLVAFLSALGFWAWSETTFLLGLITGPRRTPCPPGLSGWARFRAAFQVVRDHELAILASGLVVVLLTLDGVNQTGLWTFAILWAMRISAKINIFLGAPNSDSMLVPPNLAYITTYYRTDRISPLFPVAIVGAVAALALFVALAYRAGSPHEVVSWTILATFLTLAIVENLFLILPVSDAALWSWATGGGNRSSETDEHEARQNVIPFTPAPSTIPKEGGGGVRDRVSSSPMKAQQLKRRK